MSRTYRPSGAGGALFGGALLVAAIVIASYLSTLSTRYVLAGILLLVVFAIPTRARMLLALVIVCLLGLVRRIASPGHAAADPLLLVPIVLMALAMLSKGTHRTRLSPALSWLIAPLAAFPLVSQFASGVLAASALYGAVIVSACFAVMYAAAVGAIPYVWPTVFRWAPSFGMLLGAYGIYQFYRLPGWDRRWMEASDIASIGQPLPKLVRVFGTAEAPAAFAFILSACLIAAVVTIAKGNRGWRLTTAVVSIPVVGYAVLLTAVRAGVVALLVAFAYLVVRSASPRVAIAAVAVAGAGYAALNHILAVLSGSSALFNLSRYDVSTLGQDRSVTERLALFSDIGPGIHRPLGTGVAASDTGTAKVDSAPIDLLIKFGPLAALLFLLLLLAILLLALFSKRATSSGETTALATIAVFLIVYQFSIDIFSTTSGLLCGAIFGWMLMATATDKSGGSDPAEPRSAVVAPSSSVPA